MFVSDESGQFSCQWVICLYFHGFRSCCVAQFVTLATRFNHHRIGFDFNATDMNPAVRGKDIPFITDAKGVIIDNGQPMIRRAGKAFQNEGGQVAGHRVFACGVFIRPGGSGEKWIAPFFRIRGRTKTERNVTSGATGWATWAAAGWLPVPAAATGNTVTNAVESHAANAFLQELTCRFI